jgi:Mrp family chromosome partitioning ATPase
MPGRRPRLPVLAEIAGSEPGRERVWSLRRRDFERLAPLLERLAPTRAVLVSGTDEATTVLAVALAGAASAAGRRTVLVDCDLGRPRLAADLGLAEAPGLHEYLRWEATAPALLQPLALGGPAAAGATEPLVCIAAGREAADPVTLLGLGSFRHVAAKLRHAYELVVLAGPPLDADPAALAALAAEADGLLAALPANGSRRRAVRAARARLRRLPAPALGAVVVGES